VKAQEFRTWCASLPQEEFDEVNTFVQNAVWGKQVTDTGEGGGRDTQTPTLDHTTIDELRSTIVRLHDRLHGRSWVNDATTGHESGGIMPPDMIYAGQTLRLTMDTRPRYEPRQGDGPGLIRIALDEPVEVGEGQAGWHYLHRIVVPPLQGGHTNIRGWHKTPWRVKAEAIEHWSLAIQQQTAQVSQRFYLPEGSVVEHAWVEPNAESWMFQTESLDEEMRGE